MLEEIFGVCVVLLALRYRIALLNSFLLRTPINSHVYSFKEAHAIYARVCSALSHVWLATIRARAIFVCWMFACCHLTRGSPRAGGKRAAGSRRACSVRVSYVAHKKAKSQTPKGVCVRINVSILFHSWAFCAPRLAVVCPVRFAPSLQASERAELRIGVLCVRKRRWDAFSGRRRRIAVKVVDFTHPLGAKLSAVNYGMLSLTSSTHAGESARRHYRFEDLSPFYRADNKNLRMW